MIVTKWKKTNKKNKSSELSGIAEHDRQVRGRNCKSNDENWARYKDFYLYGSGR